MVLGLKPMGKPTTYQNQVLDRTRVLHGPRTQTYGETNYLSKLSFGQNQGIAWSSDLNLWGNQRLKEILSFGQNQGIAWFSDSNLWGNQLLKEKSKFWTEPRYCLVLGLKPMGKPTT